MSDRQIIAQDIAHDLAQVEGAIDAAIAAAGGLISRLPAYRSEAAISAVSGHEVFASMSQAMVFITSARGEVVRGHHKLEALRRAMKLDPVTAGGPVDKPTSLSLAPGDTVERELA